MPLKVHQNISYVSNPINEYLKFDGRIDHCKIFKDAISQILFVFDPFFVILQLMK